MLAVWLPERDVIRLSGIDWTLLQLQPVDHVGLPASIDAHPIHLNPFVGPSSWKRRAIKRRCAAAVHRTSVTQWNELLDQPSTTSARRSVADSVVHGRRQGFYSGGYGWGMGLPKPLQEICSKYDVPGPDLASGGLGPGHLGSLSGRL